MLARGAFAEKHCLATQLSKPSGGMFEKQGYVTLHQFHKSSVSMWPVNLVKYGMYTELEFQLGIDEPSVRPITDLSGASCFTWILEELVVAMRQLGQASSQRAKRSRHSPISGW